MARSRLRPPLWLVISLAVLVTLLVRWPLAWSLWALPAGASCKQPSGSVWRGSCGTLELQGQPYGRFAYSLRPLHLIKGELAADVQWSLGTDQLSGRIGIRPGGRIVLQNVAGQLSLGAGPLAAATRGLSGTVGIDLRAARLQGRVIEDITAELEVERLASRTGMFPVSGDLAISFPGGTVGAVRDRGGSVGLEAKLMLTPEPGYVLDGYVIQRPDTPRALVRMISMLGTPDEQGRRPISLAGTY